MKRGAVLKKSPRFFCDNCGEEVSRQAKSCPACGRFFASVRCPACGFTGAEGLFSSGCPICGYSTPVSGAPPPKRGFFAKPSAGEAAGPLPLWVYIVALTTLVAVIFLLIRNIL
ncbi:MAG: zinc ribbon domain-containing protein [Treponema sp.]|nr:zinc ribbon domain-containing protein [Treponema sp.]